MTKRVVDIDDDELEQVRTLLGARTTKATVNGALDAVLALAARRHALLEPGVLAGGPDLGDEERRRAAWA